MAALSEPLTPLQDLPARSWLFVPATQPQRYAKAAASGADRVIIDLEDAVAAEVKEQARLQLAQALLPSMQPLYLRVNSVSSAWFAADLALAAQLPLAGIMLPKAEQAADIAAVAARLPAAMVIVALVETAAGLLNALDIARAPRVERLAFGAIDFQADTGMACADAAEPELDYARSHLVVVSRVAGIGAAIDAVSVAIDDPLRLEQDTQRSRRFGFAGKLCIHPSQVAGVHLAYQPTAAQLEWAHGVLAALAERPQEERGAFSYRGAMVDKPVLAQARAILARRR